MKEKNVGVILIQINEAHSCKWPIGREYCPLPHQNFEDRVKRANNFVNIENCPYPVFIDDWTNTYENKYHAWPDEHYYVDVKSKKILKRSEYYGAGKMDGQVKEDYAIMLHNLVN